MFAASKSGSADAKDANFKNVTMLLHGNGTNGGQNNTFTDSSTNNFTITRNGNTTQGTFSPYGSNWSNYFDGSGDYLSVADNAAFDFGTGDFTIECWLYRTNNSGSGIFEHRPSASASACIWYITNTTNYLEFYNGTSYTGNVSVPQNQWVHVAVSRQSGTLRQFINGQSASSDYTVTANLDSTGSVIIMGSIDAQVYNGYCSNFRVVKGTALYTSNFTPSTTPLTAITNTSLLTCQSNRFIDNSTNNFTITKNGDVSVQRFSPFSPSTAYSTSVIGGSGYFDGSGDYLTAASSASFDVWGGNFTWECFFYPTGNLSNSLLFAWGTTSGTYISVGFFNNINIYSTVSGTNPISGTAPILNAWNHIAISKSGSTFALFVNGTRLGTSTSTSYPTGNQPVILGSNNSGGQSISGYVTDARLVKGTAVYDPTVSTLTVPTAPLTAITNTQLLLSTTNASIFDNAMMNDLETVGNAQISTSVKKYGTGSMYFDGTGDWLVGPRSWSIAASENFTIEGWFYLTAAQANYRMIVSDGTKYFSINSTGLEIQFGIVAGTVASATYSFSQNTWYYIAVVRNSNSVVIYINGTALTMTQGTQSAAFLDSGSIIYVSRYTSGSDYPWFGYIDDLRITKGVARYTANFTAPTAAFPDKG